MLERLFQLGACSLPSSADPSSGDTVSLVQRVERAIALDPLLKPYFAQLYHRQRKFQDVLDWIALHETSLDVFSSSYRIFGIHAFTNEDGQQGLRCFEWIPDVQAVYLIGEFNQWHRTLHPFRSVGFGKWDLFIPNDPQSGGPPIKKGQKIKLSIVTADGRRIERLSPWSTHVIHNKEANLFESVYYPLDFSRTPLHLKSRTIPKDLFIYEVHIGIASPEPKMTQFTEFQETVLPRIAGLGYNCIQFMAIQEHAYYGSFGYQVTSFFAVSSRFGTPEDFRSLVQAAHSLGIICILDIVHSHASKNVFDGLNELNGRDDCYFHGKATGRGDHPLWDSRCFHYGHPETLRFLLSNCRYWLEEFCLDGFRFDGITSMLYTHHGIHHSFSGYEEYFSASDVDEDAEVYLMLINYLCDAQIDRETLRIAEDVSGMPTLCRPLSEGGFGFHYRLALAVPDMWIKLLKHGRDEDWSMGHLVHVLTNRRYRESCIAYAECHDQALVGDKTIAFWLMDAAMYGQMTLLVPLSIAIDRGISLHKMIRLLVASLGGEAYLTFMGNEFGHPEWLDFPRAGNDESYWYARRQFNLPRDPLLRYQFLENFERSMVHFFLKHRYFSKAPLDYGHVLLRDEVDKMIAFYRSHLLFVFNFHPTRSFEHYSIQLDLYLFPDGRFPRAFKLVFHSDEAALGGHSRLSLGFEFPITRSADRLTLRLYTPSRVALVCEPVCAP